jgi:hypothetical protein
MELNCSEPSLSVSNPWNVSYLSPAAVMMDFEVLNGDSSSVTVRTDNFGWPGTNSRCYKPFSSSSLTLRTNKLARLFPETLSHSV